MKGQVGVDPDVLVTCSQHSHHVTPRRLIGHGDRLVAWRRPRKHRAVVVYVTNLKIHDKSIIITHADLHRKSRHGFQLRLLDFLSVCFYTL